MTSSLSPEPPGSGLEPLLAVQERDLALDRLRHRRETLPERAALADAEAASTTLRAAITALERERDAVAREEQRLGDEAGALADQATTVERRLYSGEISSPRELQALQADIEQLRRHQRTVEDRQLEAMEQREPMDERLRTMATDLSATEAAVERERTALAAAEAAIDDEMAAEATARAAASAAIDPGLLEDYEARRRKARGVGAARLVGSTCQGCHLSIPATEVDRVRHATPGSVEHCDNCGAILVP